ncbi:hypothetical protein ACFFQF_02105 [Haladaptatus pallidirubidus]|uniref:hypothetical protein n=1 Tax=Haladaptatus pallidirubidus TaxID=1008152 RepID=UPI001D0FAC5E|nr:hypothetical protein [Haladaptatus pallidirubidus]
MHSRFGAVTDKKQLPSRRELAVLFRLLLGRTVARLVGIVIRIVRFPFGRRGRFVLAAGFVFVTVFFVFGRVVTAGDNRPFRRKLSDNVGIVVIQHVAVVIQFHIRFGNLLRTGRDDERLTAADDRALRQGATLVGSVVVVFELDDVARYVHILHFRVFEGDKLRFGFDLRDFDRNGFLAEHLRGTHTDRS